MSLQIAKIVLYGKKGQLRELPFALGRLNIITGASKTGKSAIVDIVDYCTGRSECLIADGKIREHVAWYGVLFQMGEGQIFVARRNPAVGEKSSPDVYLERGSSITVPAVSDLAKNTTVDALEKFLGAAIGISENEHRPAGFTRPPLEANFRHALLLCIQDQNDIDSKQRLFHRQGEDFISTAIKDTLPYFLGAYDEEHLLKQAHLDQARRELRILERQVRDSEVVDTNTFPRAHALMDEAKGVGLVDDRTTATTYGAILEALTRVATQSILRDEMVIADENEILASLRAERQGLRNELEHVNAEIRSTRNFTTETNGYEREAKEQRARLSSVGLVQGDAPNTECPVCKSHLAQPVPTATQISQALQTLSLQLQTVEAENPRLLQRLASLEREAGLLPQHLGEFPKANALLNAKLPKATILPAEILKRWPKASPRLLNSGDRVLAGISLDHEIPPVETRGGSTPAQKLLRDFLRNKLASYAEARNKPEENATSELSPYLHFGHISVHQIFSEITGQGGWSPNHLALRATGSRTGWWRVSQAAEAFLDQVVTWRELGFNSFQTRNDYDQFESLPEWALKTLRLHTRDERSYVYTREQFERGRTHDPLWNAAQTQLVREGRIHNYLRMLWGKKILEWTRSPAKALEIMVDLNNKYALDGSDPNSYSGIFWCLGRYDRPWGPERPVFGTVRYMSSENTARKFNVQEYVRQYSSSYEGVALGK